MLTDKTVTKHAISLGTAAVLALCAIAPASAAPVLSNTAALKSAADNWATDVRWRGRWGWGAAGIIGGLALGAAAARSSYYYGYGGYPAYGYSYGYAPYSTGY